MQVSLEDLWAHLCCGFLAKVKTDVWELFSDNSNLTAILDRLSVAAPVDLRTQNTESLSPQLLHGFWSKLKEKNPKIVVTYPTVTSKDSTQKEVIWQQCHLCFAKAEYQIRGGKQFFFWTRVRQDLVVYLQKDITADGLYCVERHSSGSFITWAISYNHLNSYQTHANMLSQQNGKSEQFLETAYPKQGLFHSKRHS